LTQFTYHTGMSLSNSFSAKNFKPCKGLALPFSNRGGHSHLSRYLVRVTRPACICSFGAGVDIGSLRTGVLCMQIWLVFPTRACFAQLCIFRLAVKPLGVLLSVTDTPYFFLAASRFAFLAASFAFISSERRASIARKYSRDLSF